LPKVVDSLVFGQQSDQLYVLRDLKRDLLG